MIPGKFLSMNGICQSCYSPLFYPWIPHIAGHLQIRNMQPSRRQSTIWTVFVKSMLDVLSRGEWKQIFLLVEGSCNRERRGPIPWSAWSGICLIRNMQPISRWFIIWIAVKKSMVGSVRDVIMFNRGMKRPVAASFLWTIQWHRSKCIRFQFWLRLRRQTSLDKI